MHINYSLLISVIRFALLLLLHIVMRNVCLFESQLLTNDLELTRFVTFTSNALILTVKYLVAMSGAVQHFSQIVKKLPVPGTSLE